MGRWKHRSEKVAIEALRGRASDHVRLCCISQTGCESFQKDFPDLEMIDRSQQEANPDSQDCRPRPPTHGIKFLQKPWLRDRGS